MKKYLTIIALLASTSAFAWDKAETGIAVTGAAIAVTGGGSLIAADALEGGGEEVVTDSAATDSEVNLGKDAKLIDRNAVSVSNKTLREIGEAGPKDFVPVVKAATKVADDAANVATKGWDAVKSFL
jgi:hypothetical protein